MEKAKNNSFEQSLERLREISELLDDSEVPLDESVKLFEEGIDIAKSSYKILRDAELKVKVLKEGLESDLETLD